MYSRDDNHIRLDDREDQFLFLHFLFFPQHFRLLCPRLLALVGGGLSPEPRSGGRGRELRSQPGRRDGSSGGRSHAGPPHWAVGPGEGTAHGQRGQRHHWTLHALVGLDRFQPGQ